jgi:hypothetical protein
MYQEILMYDTVITRFKNDTAQQNREWREKNSLEHGCVYCAVGPLPASIKQTPNIFVIEMNLDTDEIIAIGLIKNRLCLKPHKVYKETRYNYFTYKSNYRISSRYFPEIFTNKEQEKMSRLENYLFKGYSHLKRGAGYSKLPEKIIYKAGKKKPDEEIENIYTDLFRTAFRRHYKK